MKLRTAFLAAIFSASTAAQASDSFSIGPNLLLGAPHPIHLSVDGRFGDPWSAALGGGTLSLKVQNGITLGITNFDVRGRWHPFGGSFFLGAIVGTQSLHGSDSQNITVSGVGTVPVTGKVDITSGFVTPHFGWLFGFGKGFTFGFELGCQVPFNPKSTVDMTVDDPSYQAFVTAIQSTQQWRQLQADIEEVANRVGKTPFPYVTLLRLGYMF